MSGFGIVMIASLVTCGILTSQTLPYYTAVGVIATHISNQVKIIRHRFKIITFTIK